MKGGKMPMYKVQEVINKLYEGTRVETGKVNIVDATKENLIKLYEDEGWNKMHDYVDMLVLYKEYHNQNLLSMIYIQKLSD